MKKFLPLTLLLFIFLCGVSIQAQAQSRQKGKVVDEKGMGISNVSVNVKGETGGTITDSTGNFVINIPPGSKILQFSYVGMIPKEADIASNKNLIVSLENSQKSSQEVVVVGYGTQKKVSLTSAVSIIDKKDLKGRAVPSVVNSLQGQVPGLNISQSHGQPGYDQTSINIRGTSTLSNNPVLVVIDGIPSTLSLYSINPSDIDNISVLKDASATSIYGARGSGGVLLVTTKIGKNTDGRPTVSYDGNFGYQKATRLPVFVDAPQYVDLYNLAIQNDNPGAVPKFDAATVAKYKSGELPSTNWLQLILSQKAVIQQHNISVSGASEKVNYFLSGSIMDQQGIMPNVGYRRDNLRSNINVHITDKLEAGINSSYVNEDKFEPFLFGELGSALGWSYAVPVTEYPFTAGGQPRTFRGGWTPYQPLYQGGLQKLSTNTLSNIFTLQYHPLPGLDIKGTYSYVYSTTDETTQQKPTTAYWDDESPAFSYPATAILTKSYVVVTNPNLILTATYAKSFGKHNFKILGGYSQESQNIEYNSLTRSGFLSDQITQIDGGNNDRSLWAMSGRAVEWAISSGFGRINYDFEGKYLLEVNGRVDGSSRFLNNRVGFFPSVSGGWVLSNEKFLQDSKIASFLKLRASYGSVGNQSALSAGGTYADQTSQTTAIYPFAALIGTSNYILNNAQSQTTYYSNIGNPDLTWETKTTTDIGVDAAFFNNRLTATIDLYDEHTSGIIRSPSVPSTFGADAPYLNSGIFQNRGYEIALAYNNYAGDFRYTFGINFSDNRTKIVSLGGTAPSMGDNPLQEGHSRWEWFGYQAEGLFQSQDDIDKHATQFNAARLKPGDVKLKDENGDGKVDADDRVILGEAQAHYSYGITGRVSYKNFDLSFLVQGVLQNMKYPGAGISSPFPGNGNILQSQTDFWTPSNTSARYPLLRLDQTVNYGSLTSWALYNGEYLRLKNLQVGYTFPRSIAKNVIRSARIYFTAENLLTFTAKDYPKEADPELGNYISAGNYPQLQVLSLGLNVTF